MLVLITDSFLDGLSAPGTYNWQVAVPVDVVEGNYQLAVVQNGSDPVYSPAFALVIPPEAASSTSAAPMTTLPFPAGAGASASASATASVTAIYLPYPANATFITYIYYEEECGCHRTSTCAQSELPATMSATTATYSEPACGCTTTVEASCAPTVITMSPSKQAAAATNTPVAPTTAPAPPVVQPTPTMSASSLPTYTGTADKLAGSSFGFLAMVAALVMV